MDETIRRVGFDDISRVWTLIYGRRKVGKTFILKHFVKLDYYTHVGRDGTVWVERADVERFTTIDDFFRFARGALQAGKVIAIDEFQRLPEYVLERIATVHPNGCLVLSGSNMSVARKIMGKGSPLLGLLAERHVNLARPSETVASLSNLGADAVDYATYARDPWVIPFMDGHEIVRDLYSICVSIHHTIPALIGEIFREEDRKLTATYDGIMRCIGSGIHSPSMIASTLNGRGIIGNGSASAVVPFINNLVSMGIVKKIGIHNRKSELIRMVSPIFTVYYYLNDRFGLEEHEVPLNVIRPTLEEVHRHAIEDFFGEFLAEKLGGYYQVSLEPEIDAIITDRKQRPLAVAEVKWGKVKKGDVEKFLNKVSAYNCRKFLITKQSIDVDGLEVLTPRNLLSVT